MKALSYFKAFHDNVCVDLYMMKKYMASEQKCKITEIETIMFKVISFYIDEDNCIDVNCLNGGTCIDNTGSYSCKCPAGFEGHHCGKGNALDIRVCYFLPKKSRWSMIDNETNKYFEVCNTYSKTEKVVSSL